MSYVISVGSVRLIKGRALNVCFDDENQKRVCFPSNQYNTSQNTALRALVNLQSRASGPTDITLVNFLLQNTVDAAAAHLSLRSGTSACAPSGLPQHHVAFKRKNAS
jgi:hypothetical protein